MKNKSYIGIAFIILVFGIIFVPRIVNRIKDGKTVQNDRLSVSNGENTNETLFKIGPAPQFELTNQEGKKITNKDYEGKVYVLEFFFSTCPTICPRMNQNMLTIQNKFSKELDFGIASITINPENDTPQVLKDHAQKLGVTSKNWHLLTGDKTYIMNLANKGFNLYAGENSKVNGGFEHSGLFALIDKKGNIRCRKDEYNNPIMYYDGLEAKGVNAIKEDIQLLLEE
ncbi:SCO family protein [Flavobacterium sp.]|uniref:SCO family protein n=1 Tax=Flavobacterium sp. TaxID=239 RepID=UPI002B4AF832|nr:SCO family protein [Flavobacterium sp.]HLP62867.1 SCO family protein [Flavobacterium sp.]